MTRTFAAEQVARIEPLSVMAEEVTARSIRGVEFTSHRFSYDILTARECGALTLPRRALAQLTKVVRRTFGVGRRFEHRFRVVLNDQGILDRVGEDRDAGKLDAILIYVLTHELIHIARFATFKRSFYANGLKRIEEERLVHSFACDALRSCRLPKSMGDIETVLRQMRPA